MNHDPDAGRDEKERHMREQKIRRRLQPLDPDNPQNQGEQKQSHTDDTSGDG